MNSTETGIFLRNRDVHVSPTRQYVSQYCPDRTRKSLATRTEKITKLNQ